MRCCDSKKFFLENEKNLKVKTFKLSDIFDQHDNIDRTIKSRIQEISFHNLEMVKPLFLKVLSVDIGEIGDLVKAVHKRHDIVHRNGKDKDGNKINISENEISTLFDAIAAFCKGVFAQTPRSDDF